jgi:hypothetical protein
MRSSVAIGLVCHSTFITADSASVIATDGFMSRMGSYRLQL